MTYTAAGPSDIRSMRMGDLIARLAVACMVAALLSGVLCHLH
jgi:hypothetical protein